MKTSALALGLALAAPGAWASYVVTVGFNEPAFPTATTSLTGTTQSYNVFNDATGAKFTTLPVPAGDAADFSIAFASQSGARAAPNPPAVEYQTASSGRFTSTRGFSNSPAISTDNPGTIASTTMRLLFGSQLQVTNLSATLQSLNTAGIAWEYSLISYLRPDGSLFSAPPTITGYSAYTGATGMAGTGNYVAADKGTVVGVGSSQTSAGRSGPADDLTLTYALVGLAPGTQIGGIQITNFLQDVRGTGNGTTSFTASFSDMTLTAAAAPLDVPEPPSIALGAVALVALLASRRKRPSAGSD